MKRVHVFIRHSLIIICMALVLPVAIGPSVYAVNVLDPACQGFRADDLQAPTACQDNDDPQEPNNNSIYGPNGIITKGVSIISIVIGIAAIIMIIVGSFRYVMSSGDANSINGAKNTILYAIIGLGVSLFAQAIIIFVIKKL